MVHDKRNTGLFLYEKRFEFNAIFRFVISAGL